METNNQHQPNAASPHTLGYLQHAHIKQEVGLIDEKGEYDILEIYPDGKKFSSHHKGNDIKNHYPEIFGAYLHAFVVSKGGELVFVYTGPIPDKVAHILGTNTIH